MLLATLVPYARGVMLLIYARYHHRALNFLWSICAEGNHLQREWAKQFGGDKQSLEDYKLFESFFIAVRPCPLQKTLSYAR